MEPHEKTVKEVTASSSKSKLAILLVFISGIVFVTIAYLPSSAKVVQLQPEYLHHKHQSNVKQPSNTTGMKTSTSKVKVKIIKTATPSPSHESATCSFEARADVSKASCEDLPRDPIRPYYYFEGKVTKYFNILVDDKHKLLFCSIPKAGCTSWKNYLVLMSDKGKRSKKSMNMKVHNRNLLRGYGLKFLSEYKPAQIQARLKTYNKFLVTRHPFARLYSAYVDKYYDHLYSAGITRRIITKYRPKGAPSPLSPKTNKIYPTFEEFSRFVVSEYPAHFREAHWTTYQDLCYPCDIDYDHILKLETMDTDADAFLKLPLMADGADIELPKFNPSSASKAADKLRDAFKTLPLDLVKDLYHLYEKDFKMYGYSWDFDNLRASCNSTANGCC